MQLRKQNKNAMKFNTLTHANIKQENIESFVFCACWVNLDVQISFVFQVLWF